MENGLTKTADEWCVRHERGGKDKKKRFKAYEGNQPSNLGEKLEEG